MTASSKPPAPGEQQGFWQVLIDEFKMGAWVLAGFLVLLGLLALSDTAWWWLFGTLLALAITLVTVVLFLATRRSRRDDR